MEDDQLTAALAEYADAGTQLRAWIVGAQSLALLRAAVRSPLWEALQRPQTLPALAVRLGVTSEDLADLCTALYALGIVDRDGERVQLAPAYHRLSAPEAPQSLANAVEQGWAFARILAEGDVLGGVASYPALSDQDQLASAKGVWGLPGSSVAQGFFRRVDAAMPEVRDAWEAGARHIELGCGAGRDLLRIPILYPAVSVVGVDTNAAVLQEVQREAAALGVADRVSVRQQDAREMDDEDAFDTALWSQMFFPLDTRKEVLRRLHRALKPAGYLLLPLLAGRPSTPEALRSAGGAMLSIMAMVFRGWGLPLPSVEEVSAEVEGAGFTVLRVIPNQRTPYLVARRR